MGRKNWSGSQTPTTPVTAGPTIGDLSFAQLVKLLGPAFLPASLGSAPLAQGTGGNRTTVLTSKSSIVTSVNNRTGAVTLVAPPIEVTLAALVGGTYTWTYSSAFTSAPVVFVSPIGFPPAYTDSASGYHYLAQVVSGTPSATACVITSTYNGDTRPIMLVAIGNPS